MSSINSLEHHDISNNYEKWGGEKKSLYNSRLQVFSLVATTAIGYTAIATSATAEISQQDHLIIAQFAPRGREFVCQFNGSGTTIAPNISGSFIHDIYCYIPAQGRQCVAVYDGIFGSVTGSDWKPCDNNNMKIVTDPNTGKKYYELNSVHKRFIFSK
ncbi:MAG: hypothetical protein EWV58_21055 [Microcystis aeruginosa Ma_MB_F_20061100_S19]|uniref:hypothetical protein n=1 Tax=Microcystis aeruginosa TaxID=1126 RepID=UPI0006925CA9|nr:hypothetical protein [Microcystis aeruginosa]TRU09981.1 MAG: hypothetical protein EWV58_21055 [Microcystis aeruginosa Ma_MB_F_20061100_S19]TRU11772.1 MAG: hypothetical protein EWV59_09890 [Microcystis aeruginosa Ma_MB_F_20061100_S19D]